MICISERLEQWWSCGEFGGGKKPGTICLPAPTPNSKGQGGSTLPPWVQMDPSRAQLKQHIRFLEVTEGIWRAHICHATLHTAGKSLEWGGMQNPQGDKVRWPLAQTGKHGVNTRLLSIFERKAGMDMHWTKDRNSNIFIGTGRAGGPGVFLGLGISANGDGSWNSNKKECSLTLFCLAHRCMYLISAAYMPGWAKMLSDYIIVSPP